MTNLSDKKLIYISWDNCPDCGNCAGLEEHSFAGEYADESVYDSQGVYCDECGLKGVTVVDDICDAYVEWETKE